MRSFTLRFDYLGAQFQLIETTFQHELLPQPLHCIRGKIAGAYAEAGTFQWTRAVKALVLVMVRAYLYEQHLWRDGALSGGLDRAKSDLYGYRGSLAASLDASISKSPCWLAEMFGTDARGLCLVERLLSRSNSGLRRPGPIAVSLNRRFIESKELHFEDFTGNLLAEESLYDILFQLSRLDSIPCEGIADVRTGREIMEPASARAAQ